MHAIDAMDAMELRRIRADEGDAYREVRLRALQLAPDAYEVTYEESLELPPEEWRALAESGAESMEAAIFVIDRGDGSLAGTVFVRVNESAPYDAFLGGFWVDEDLRGGQAAEGLLDAAEAFARRRGAQSAELWVEDDNVQARRLYSTHGYAETGISLPGRRGTPSILMQKPLDGAGGYA